MVYVFFLLFSFDFEKHFEVYQHLTSTNKKIKQNVVNLEKCKWTIQTSWSFKKFYLPTIRLHHHSKPSNPSKKVTMVIDSNIVSHLFQGIQISSYSLEGHVMNIKNNYI